MAPQPRAPFPPPSPAHSATMSDKAFNILQWNVNGNDNKQTELSIFLEAHNVNSKWRPFRSPSSRHNREVLLFFFHNEVNFTRKPLSTQSKNNPQLEELTISIAMDNTELLITNMYITRPAPAMGVIHHQSTTC